MKKRWKRGMAIGLACMMSMASVPVPAAEEGTVVEAEAQDQKNNKAEEEAAARAAQEAAEKAAAEAAERAAQEAAEKAAAEAAARAAQEAAEKAAAEAAARAAQEAAEKAAAEAAARAAQEAAEKAAAEAAAKAAQEAAEKAAAEKAAQEAAEKAAAEKAAQEAAEKAAAEKTAQEAAEKAAAEKAAQEAAEKAAAEKAARETAEPATVAKAAPADTAKEPEPKAGETAAAGSADQETPDKDSPESTIEDEGTDGAAAAASDLSEDDNLPGGSISEAPADSQEGEASPEGADKASEEKEEMDSPAEEGEGSAQEENEDSVKVAPDDAAQEEEEAPAKEEAKASVEEEEKEPAQEEGEEPAEEEPAEEEPAEEEPAEEDLAEEEAKDAADDEKEKEPEADGDLVVREISVSIVSEDASFAYDGAAHSVSAENQIYTVHLTGEGTDETITAAGGKAIPLGSGQAALTITPGDVSVTHVSESGAKNSFTAQIVNPEPAEDAKEATVYALADGGLVFGTLTVTPRKVLVTADDKEMRKGEALPVLTASVSGLAETDSEEKISYRLSVEDGAADTVGIHKISVTGDAVQADGDYEVSFDDEGGKLTVLSNYTRLAAQVVWDDEDNIDQIRPPVAYITLYTGAGTPVASYELSDGNDWTAVMPGDGKELPAKDASGNPIDYSGYYWFEEETLRSGDPGDVENMAPIGYTHEKEADVIDGNERRTIIRNVHTPLKKENVTVRRIQILWEDDAETEKYRPKQVPVQLSNGQTVILSAENGWTAEVADLPVYYEGTRYVYEWEVPSIENYQPILREIDTVMGGSGDDLYAIGETTILTYECLWETVTKTVKTPVDVKDYLLTINYWKGTDRLTQAFDSFTAALEKGQSYYEKSPFLAGYTADRLSVSGTIQGNTTVNVYYVPNRYTLSVQYRYLDGSAAAPEYRGSYRTGTGYSVTSPQIPGYMYSAAVYEGTMPGRNVSYVVYYYPVVPAQREETQPSAPEETVIEDYQTPLAIGGVTVNAGDCFE